MTILLVRHASAGDRSDWEGEDELRPIDAGGRDQAEGLADILLEYGVTRVLSSPAARCIQTVAPLAERLGLLVEERFELSEGSASDTVAALLDGSADDTAVVCTHGDVIQNLIGEEPPKGSTWVLERSDQGLARRRYLPPTVVPGIPRIDSARKSSSVM